MTKKSVFQKMFEEEFNPKKTHDEIIYKVERKKINTKILKYCLPIFILSIVCGSIILNSKNGILKPHMSNSTNYKDTMHINNMSSIDTKKIDADIRTANIDDSYFSILNDLKVPKDFDNKIYNAIYIKDGNNHFNTENDYSNDDTSSEYNLLNNYAFIYENTSNNRNITISFSDTFEPVRDYYFEEIGNLSQINNVKMSIYKYENSYLTKFNYQNYNFDIETHNITEEELVNLLKSIIKK